MQLSGAEKLNLNACMLRLSKEWDPESASAMVRTFHNLPAIKLPHKVSINATTKTDTIKRFEHVEINVSEILFWHFWASDPETMSEDADQPTFYIEYDLDNLEPYALTRHEWGDWVEKPPSVLDHLKIFFLYLIGLDAEVYC